MRSFKQSVQETQPDDDALALKRDADNQLSFLLIISYFVLFNSVHMINIAKQNQLMHNMTVYLFKLLKSGGSYTYD
jgi:hypothetical protein